MNHIVKPFRPYFNTPLDLRRTQGMIAYYDATTQQGGGYLADKVGNRHGVFANNPTWQDGNAVKTVRTLSQNVETAGFTRLTYPFTVVVDMMLIDTVVNTIFVGFPAPYDEGPNNYKLICRTADGNITIAGEKGFSPTYFPINIFKKLVIIYISSMSRKIYINGNEIPEINTNDYYRHNSNSIIIGARKIGDSPDYFGSVAVRQLAIFNRALTRGEILAHYQDPYYFYERPKIYGFISSSSGSSLPVIINNYRQQGVM